MDLTPYKNCLALTNSIFIANEEKPYRPCCWFREHIDAIDINDYRDATLRQLEHKAKMMADRAVSFKTTVELEPMSSYERMFVHALFTDNQNIKTESIGEGKERHLTLKFVESPIEENF